MENELFWYERDHLVIIGIRGISEFRIPKWDLWRAEDSFRLRTGRSWTHDEVIEWVTKWDQKESEYVDFEEIPIEIKLLGPAK